jgi:hypothetical protein
MRSLAGGGVHRVIVSAVQTVLVGLTLRPDSSRAIVQKLHRIDCIYVPYLCHGGWFRLARANIEVVTANGIVEDDTRGSTYICKPH